jgi:tripartite ATP-independent transporter DctM subunit
MSLALTVIFCVIMVLAVPVGHALVIAAGLALMWDGTLPLNIVAQQLYQQTQSFPMLALPFFMMAGSLMLSGKLGEGLLTFTTKALQGWRGGPLSTMVVSSVVFGGCSGSAVADASALGSILIPWQKKQGFPAALCAANNATASIIAILIPPSIPLILYSLVSGASIADLFIAGILPGVLLAIGLMGVCWWVSGRRGLAPKVPHATWVELGNLALLSSPALMMPVLILAGLRFGFATPTEVAVLAVVYAAVVSAVVYRDLTWARFRESIIGAGIATGIVMLVIMGSAICGWILTFDQVPATVAAWVSQNVSSPFLILLLMNAALLVIGMPLDLPPAILLLGPIFVPMAKSIGLDLVQLGLIMVLNLGIGLYTPPIGTTLFISTSIAGAPLGETTRELWPFFAVSILVLLAITYIPALTIY